MITILYKESTIEKGKTECELQTRDKRYGFGGLSSSKAKHGMERTGNNIADYNLYNVSQRVKAIAPQTQAHIQTNTHNQHWISSTKLRSDEQYPSN